MNNLDAYIKTINEKLQRLIKNHSALKKENQHLKEDIIKLKEKNQSYTSTLAELDQKVHILQASSGQMAENDQKAFEKRINRYIKEIDKCIGMLSE